MNSEQKKQTIKNIDIRIAKLEKELELNPGNNKIMSAIIGLQKAKNDFISQQLQKPQTMSEKEEEELGLAELEAEEQANQDIAAETKEQARQDVAVEAQKEQQVKGRTQKKNESRHLKTKEEKRIAKEKAQQKLVADKNLEDIKKSEAKYANEQQQKEIIRGEEIAEKVKVLKKALEPELQHCAPAKTDPGDNYDSACKVLGIKDLTFIQKPAASNILQNAYADMKKVCDTGKSKYNKYDYRTNIDKAYEFLKVTLRKKEESELLEQVRAEGRENLEQRNKKLADAAAKKLVAEERTRMAQAEALKLREKELDKIMKKQSDAIKPEQVYCAPAKTDPGDSYPEACMVLGIQDPDFIYKPAALNILQKAYDNRKKKCVTGKSTYNTYNYEPNIEKAYTFLRKTLEKREQDKAAADAVTKKAAAEKAKEARIAELENEISRADQNVEKIKKEEEKAAKKIADATAKKVEEKNTIDQINGLDLSAENTLQQKQELLKTLRKMRGQQIQLYKYTCEDEPPSLVGIDSPNYNNCYLNALFQMLFHMCYFRRAILDDNDTDFTPAIEELADILYRYQQLYLLNRYELLFLTDIDYFSIKQATLENPQEDIQQDPMEILKNVFFEGTGEIANDNIYNNPESDFGSQYVYQLTDINGIDRNLQLLINEQEINFFNGVKPNTDQKYIILNYPRFQVQGNAAKKTNSIIANPRITINTIVFGLKGIIVHLGPNTASGHYIYVTFKNNGRQIDKIYNNLSVIDGGSREPVAQTSKQQRKVLEKRTEQFEQLMNPFIQNYNGDKQKLREIRIKVLANNYLLGHSEETLEQVFKTFVMLWNEGNHQIDAKMFERDVNKIDFSTFQDTINRNGTIFLYENIIPPITPAGPPITPAGPPITPAGTGPPPGTGPIIPAQKQELQEATKAAMSLFQIPSNKTFFQFITIKELTNKKNSLLEKINNNVTESPTELITIVDQAYKYLSIILDKIKTKIIGRALNHLPLELLDDFYTTLDVTIITELLRLSGLFLTPYKKLNYTKSMIIQRPKLNGTRKNICEELGQLNPLLNSQKGIPSLFRKLTRKITREEIYKPIKARIVKKEAETKKAEEKKTNETKNKIESMEKELKELQTQKILARIEYLSQEITDLRANPATTPSDLNRKLSELRQLKSLLELEKQPPKKGVKGGTNKIIRITQQKKNNNNKKTRKLN